MNYEFYPESYAFIAIELVVEGQLLPLLLNMFLICRKEVLAVDGLLQIARIAKCTLKVKHTNLLGLAT